MSSNLTVDPQVAADFANTIRPTLALASLEANRANLVWQNGVSVSRDRTSGSSVNIAKLGALTPRSSDLSASADPSPLDFDGDTLANIALHERGDHIQFSSAVILQREIPTVREMAQQLAQHESESLDLQIGTAAVAGTNVLFAGGRANAGALQAGDVFNAGNLLRVKAMLTGYDGTRRAPKMPFGDYAAFVHSLSIQDAFAQGGGQGFLDRTQYNADPNAVLTGEIGKWHGFRFFEADQANYTSLAAGDDAGDFTSDLITGVFCGLGYLGEAVGVMPTGVQGPYPAGDKMGRFWLLRWYYEMGYAVCKSANGVVLKSRSAYALNP